MTDDLFDRLRGPHEWGYRDPTTGDFVDDPAPLDAADALAAAREREARLRGLIQCLLDNDPNDVIDDAGHTVLCKWRHDARSAIQEPPA